ncbi:MAG: hypothetical protein AMS22_13150 [Thiotrichales bacterium SG8_50]|nr:MAG: hypothetical protein AMS22_13150 [Thiotrichales bacterium SG8_50]
MGFLRGHQTGVMDGVINGGVKTTSPTTMQDVIDTELLYSNFCIPCLATIHQLAIVFLKYMGEPPEKHHYGATIELDLALFRYYPCKK